MDLIGIHQFFFIVSEAILPQTVLKIILDHGLFCKIFSAIIAVVIVQLNISQFSSQIIMRSASQSKATHKSAQVCLTF